MTYTPPSTPPRPQRPGQEKPRGRGIEIEDEDARARIVRDERASTELLLMRDLSVDSDGRSGSGSHAGDMRVRVR